MLSAQNKIRNEKRARVRRAHSPYSGGGLPAGFGIPSPRPSRAICRMVPETASWEVTGLVPVSRVQVLAA